MAPLISNSQMAWPASLRMTGVTMDALLAFVKWFFVTAIVGMIVGGLVGGSIGTDFESSRQAGRAVGAIVWPIVFVVSIAGTLFSVSREKKRHAKELSKPRISDLYQQDRDGAG